MIRKWQIKTRKAIPALLIVALVLLAACNRNEEEATPETLPQATTVSEAVETVVETAVEPTATPPPPPAPTATEQALVPAVSVTDQVLEDDGQLVISQVVAAEAGWVVVYTDAAGSPGEVLGYTAVDQGQNEDIAVQIEALLATETLHVLLHTDAGDSGVFDYPGPDNPVNGADGAIEAMFVVDRRTTIPTIAVDDQELTEDGLVVIASVVSKGPGWLVLYSDEAGQPGRMMGYLPVESGTTENLSIAINWREATPTLYAALYEDAGQEAVFEVPDPDERVMMNSEPLLVSFVIGLPPDVFVLNQPVVNNKIVVERATSQGPGWLVVYRDEEGQTGNIIGFAPLEDGVNELIEVDILTSDVSAVLHIIIHEDDGTLGEFDFPAGDGPMRFNGQLPINPFDFRTDTGNYLILEDQPLSAANTITISLVVVDVDAWVTIHTNSAEQQGQVIGQLWLPAGLYRDVVIELDPELTTITMYVVLHLDTGQPEVFEYPDGVDIPLQRNRNFIQVPFTMN
jgi:hypothetical protein